ncbi:MAG: sigma-70 family RNA polymerase sigma factor [Planctomycetes bacterium]|nr:sigma-70 family RNA polymerase sigma factor [Planctomycetota bacterium]
MTLPPDSCDSVVLAQSVSGGDQQALALLLERFLPELRAFIRLRSGPKLLAQESPDDLVQSVCREVLGDLGSFDYRSEQAFKSWLFLSALHKVQDKGRYYAAEKRDAGRAWAVEDPALLSGYVSLLSPSRVASAREDVARLEAVFDQLPDDYREVITLHRLLGLDHEQIAERMGKTPGASRVLLHRALARLGRLTAAAESGEGP